MKMSGKIVAVLKEEEIEVVGEVARTNITLPLMLKMVIKLML